MQEISSRQDTSHQWADARRWLLVVPVALLPFGLALIALIIVKTVLSTLGIPMFTFAYFLAAGGSAYLSVMWSAGIPPHRGWDVGRTLSVTYVVISVAALVVLLVIDQHPPQTLDRDETPELIQMLALGGLGVGALGGYIRALGTRPART
jgi:hypothetical protein